MAVGVGHPPHQEALLFCDLVTVNLDVPSGGDAGGSLGYDQNERKKLIPGGGGGVGGGGGGCGGGDGDDDERC